MVKWGNISHSARTIENIEDQNKIELKQNVCPQNKYLAQQKSEEKVIMTHKRFNSGNTSKGIHSNQLCNWQCSMTKSHNPNPAFNDKGPQPPSSVQ